MWHTWQSEELCTELWSELKGKDHSEDSGVDGRVILHIRKGLQGVIGAGVA
jgi:hypothetical protein